MSSTAISWAINLLALFGAPVAHEDDPERAVRAGLDIIRAARVYADDVRESWGVEDKNVPLRGRLPFFYRDVRVWSIAGGANEIKRNIIAQRGLGLPRD